MSRWNRHDDDGDLSEVDFNENQPLNHQHSTINTSLGPAYDEPEDDLSDVEEHRHNDELPHYGFNKPNPRSPTTSTTSHKRIMGDDEGIFGHNELNPTGKPPKSLRLIQLLVIVILLLVAGSFLYGFEVAVSDIRDKKQNKKRQQDDQAWKPKTKPILRPDEIEIAPGLHGDGRDDASSHTKPTPSPATPTPQPPSTTNPNNDGSNPTYTNPDGSGNGNNKNPNLNSQHGQNGNNNAGFEWVSELYQPWEEEETDTQYIPFQHPEITYYRREWIRNMARFAWDGYFLMCPGQDEVKPVSGKCNNWLLNGASAVDSLSLFLLMNEKERYNQALAITQALDPKLTFTEQTKVFNSLFPTHSPHSPHQIDNDDSTSSNQPNPSLKTLSTSSTSSPLEMTTSLSDSTPSHIQTKEKRRVSFFETTIRVLAGFLSQYDLTQNPTYLQRAISTADALMPAFDMHTSGFPTGGIDLVLGVGNNNDWCSNCYILADVATIQVEFCALTSAIYAYEADFKSNLQNYRQEYDAALKDWNQKNRQNGGSGGDRDNDNGSGRGPMDIIAPIEDSSIGDKKKPNRRSTHDTMSNNDDNNDDENNDSTSYPNPDHFAPQSEVPYQFTTIYHPHEYCQRAHHVTTTLYAFLHSHEASQHHHLFPIQLYPDTFSLQFQHGITSSERGLRRRGPRDSAAEKYDQETYNKHFAPTAGSRPTNIDPTLPLYIADNYNYYSPLLFGKSYIDDTIRNHVAEHWIKRHNDEDLEFHHITNPTIPTPAPHYNPGTPGFYSRLENENGKLLPFDPRWILMSIQAYNHTGTPLPQWYAEIAPHWVSALYTSKADRVKYDTLRDKVSITADMKRNNEVVVGGKDSVVYEREGLAQLLSQDYIPYFGLTVRSNFLYEVYNNYAKETFVLPEHDPNPHHGNHNNHNINTKPHLESLSINAEQQQLPTPLSIQPLHLDPYSTGHNTKELTDTELYSPVRSSLYNLFNAYHSKASGPVLNIKPDQSQPQINLEAYNDSNFINPAVTTPIQSAPITPTTPPPPALDPDAQRKQADLKAIKSFPLQYPHVKEPYKFNPIPSGLHHTYTQMTKFVTGYLYSSTYSVGPMSDSAYEYFVKTWIVTGKKNPIYLDLYQKTMRSILTNIYFELPKTPQFLSKMRYARHLNRFFTKTSTQKYNVETLLFPPTTDQAPNGFHRYDGVDHKVLTSSIYPNPTTFTLRDQWVTLSTSDNPESTIFNGVESPYPGVMAHLGPNTRQSTKSNFNNSHQLNNKPQNDNHAGPKLKSTSLPNMTALINPKIQNRVIKWLTTNPIAMMVDNVVSASLPLDESTQRGTAMHHLSCFIPGNIALGLMHGAFNDQSNPQNNGDFFSGQNNQTFAQEALDKAESMARGCVVGYLLTQATGLAPENYQFSAETTEIYTNGRRFTPSFRSKNTTPPKTFPSGFFPQSPTQEELDFTTNLFPTAPTTGQLRKGSDAANFNLRPETIESLYMLYRLTGNQIYREIIWMIMVSLEQACKTRYGYTNIQDVHEKYNNSSDSQESFLFSEVFKYAWLAFEEGAGEPIEQGSWKDQRWESNQWNRQDGGCGDGDNEGGTCTEPPASSSQSKSSPKRSRQVPTDIDFDAIVDLVHRRHEDHDNGKLPQSTPKNKDTQQNTNKGRTILDSPLTSPSQRLSSSIHYQRLSESNFMSRDDKFAPQGGIDHLSSANQANQKEQQQSQQSQSPHKVKNQHRLLDLNRFVFNTEGHPIRVRPLDIDQLMIDVLQP